MKSLQGLVFSSKKFRNKSEWIIFCWNNYTIKPFSLVNKVKIKPLLFENEFFKNSKKISNNTRKNSVYTSFFPCILLFLTKKDSVPSNFLFFQTNICYSLIETLIFGSFFLVYLREKKVPLNIIQYNRVYYSVDQLIFPLLNHHFKKIIPKNNLFKALGKQTVLGIFT